MDELPVTRAHLESLTTSDLIRMADSFGIDIPPDLDRIFIIEELLDSTSEDDTADFPDNSGASSDDTSSDESKMPKTNMANSVDESAPLPAQYNITFIEVMIRDPLWAFVFWEVKTQDKEQFEKAQDFDGYYLKVSPYGTPMGSSAGKPEAGGVFMVPVKPDDSAWYLGLTAAVVNEKPGEDHQYKVELCAGRKGDETVLAVSNPFRLPGLPEVPGSGRVWENPLARLSGYGDFHTLRSSERPVRAKRGLSADTYE